MSDENKPERNHWENHQKQIGGSGKSKYHAKGQSENHQRGNRGGRINRHGNNAQDGNRPNNNTTHTGRLQATKDSTADRYNKKNTETQDIQDVCKEFSDSKITEPQVTNKINVEDLPDNQVSTETQPVEVESWENIPTCAPQSLEQFWSTSNNYKPAKQTSNRCQDNKFKPSKHSISSDSSWGGSPQSPFSDSGPDKTVSPNTSKKESSTKLRNSTDSSSRLNPNAKIFTTNELSFQYYEKNIWKKKSKEFKHVVECEADLFSMSDEYSLANCVAEDMNMGSGIAVTFRQKFKRVGELIAQKAKQGGLAYLDVDGRFIYYLVTKRESNQKPTLDTMFKSLCKLKEHMVANNVKKLAAPTLGCGLDRLEWADVKEMLEYVFTGTDITVTICIFQKAEEVMSVSKINHVSRKCKLVMEDRQITALESGTLILYIGTEDGYVSPQLRLLDSRFPCIQYYRNQTKTVGKHFVNYAMDYGYALYACIVNKSKNDPFNFNYFEECIRNINKENNKAEKRNEKYFFVAMQTVTDPSDDLIMSKINNMLRNTFYGVTIHIFP